MISLHRVFAVLKKDFVWAQSNLKLLGIMIMPVFIVVLFSNIDGDATFVYAVTFVNAFVGIFSTSYLIIEEKNKGTLLALLTSPLRNHELLLAKFLFTLALCLLFTALAAVMNGRLDIFTNPLIVFNLALFAGTTCFFGYSTGLFFKNEQEMSIFAPILMFAFILGETVDRISSNGDIYAYFPDYHFSRLIRTVKGVSWSDFMVHTSFNIVYFSGALIFAALYTRFYFSNNREKRFSKPLFGVLLGIIGLFVLSGVFSPSLVDSKQKEGDQDGMVEHRFLSTLWSGVVKYDPTQIQIKTLLESESKKIYKLEAIDKSFEMTWVLRNAEDDEIDVKTRDKKVRNDEERSIVGVDHVVVSGVSFKKWTYFKKQKLIFLAEAFCGKQLLQAASEIKIMEIKKVESALGGIDRFLQNLEPKCSQPES